MKLAERKVLRRRRDQVIRRAAIEPDFTLDLHGHTLDAAYARFDQGLAQSFDYSFSLTGDPRQSARFRVRQFGFYAGDMWRAAQNLTLTLGVRADIVQAAELKVEFLAVSFCRSAADMDEARPGAARIGLTAAVQGPAS